ncbi:hypothetical protein [Alteromonas lipolytica]|uniref:Uncharacterized protein n=1 Tax=Alteromonas lipolytica TaxID=1856405 RepID=A0A1E8FDH8_9ALTE|nr:hypothetical protein [Alteromonas lipolytica]OFI33816.1 hypothetical protein BFC17_19805 [Alteromonas lipolytica]GGF68122.1 hypothetical protein GCM10011338_20420 [Alteromonas lipolytica]
MLKFHTSLVLFTVLAGLLYSTIAESALIRGGGRGSKTSTAPQSYYLIEDANTVVGPDGITLSANNYQSVLGSSPRHYFTDGNQHLIPVPDQDCYEEMDWSTYESIPPEYLPDWNGCSYEFYTDESLFTFGSFFAYLPGAASYDILWTLTNQNGDAWEFTGSDTFIDHEGGNHLIYYNDFNNPIYSNAGMVFLDAVIPVDMPMGDYTIDLSVTMQSGSDKTFFYYQDEHSPLSVDCTTVVEPDDFCFVSSGLYASDSLTFNVQGGFTETLTIKARVQDVAAPATFSLWACLAFLVVRRRRLS